VTFSEDVWGVGLEDFSLVEGGGISGATLSAASGSKNAYVITAGTGSGEGTLQLTLPTAVTITDFPGNSLSGLP
jgi:MSHA biogenesis protein MshQ